MEQKTIGGFIAALRKANGMTQRELAERLNVSDKTVSRWERDDGAPDLSAIPVIAEIFGVTCDELLRGERRPSAERAELPAGDEPTPKGEKQRRRLLKVTLSQYRSRTYISIGVAAVGLIAALIGNLAFNRASLGFLLGAVFFVAAVVCQVVFVNRALLSVEDAGIEADALSAFRLQVIRLAQRSVGVTVALTGFTFPLVLVDAYLGLGADSMLLSGLLGTAAFLALYAVVCWFLNARLLKQGVLTMEAAAEAKYWRNHRRKRSCTVGLAVALALTLFVHALGSELIWSTYAMAQGTVFHDYDSFIAYMEQELPPAESVWYTAAPDQAPPVAAGEAGIWYGPDGSIVTEEEARTKTLEDINGEVVCTYIHRNEEVSSIRYSPKEGTVLPITVFTAQEYRAARNRSELITAACFALYPIEVLGAFLIYFRKRER